MAQFHKLEKEVELKCCADKIFQMFLANQSNIPDVCSHNVQSNKVLQGGWTCVGSTRKWDCVIDGKAQCIIERIDAIDEENKIIYRSMVDADILKIHYKTFANKFQVIPKENECCVLKLTFEYEKINEDAPEPHQIMEFSLDTINKLACHLASAN